MRLLESLALIVSITATCVGQPSPPLNFRIFPSAVTQTEPVAVVHPENPNIIFASAVTINTSNAFKSEGVYVSTNGGLNWAGWDSCRGQSIVNHGGDPAIGIHPSGQMILAHIGSVFPGWYSHYSTNLGVSWSNAFTISSQLTEDKGSATMDETPTSPYYGRMYLCWVALVQPYPALLSYSTNAGTSWTVAAQINPAPPTRCSGGSITAGRDGKVYAAWTGVIAASPFTEDFAGFAVSTNGGATWSPTQNAFDMNGIAGTLPAKSNIKVNGLPQIEIDRSGTSRDGWLYIVAGERGLAPAGTDPDIILHRSTNGGQTWSAGIRVNQDPLNNGRTQYFPAMAIDQAGGVNIIYYDDRNTATDSSEIVLARSTDGGTTWAERVISDHRFKPKPIVGGSSNYQGDHISLLAIGTKLHAFWMDDFTGLYQAWTTIVDWTTDVVEVDDGTLPHELELSQNYPNPFNPATTLQYHVPGAGFVSLEVFDITGRVVATLVSTEQRAGTYSLTFMPDEKLAASGVYVVRLQHGAHSLSRKILYLR